MYLDGKIRQKSAYDRKFEDAFCRMYIPFIYFLTGKYTTAAEEREEISQDVLVRLVKVLPSLRHISHERICKYIALTVRSVYLDRCRDTDAAVRKQYKEQEMLLEKVLLDEGDLMHLISARLDVQRLRKELPEREWKLLKGKYILGLDQKELAEIAGVAPDSVRMLLSRARKAAREILETHRKGEKRSGR